MTPTLSGAIDHVHVYVPSRRTAAAWYQEKLGFSVMEEFAFWAEDDGGPLTISGAANTIHFALFRSTESRPVSLAFGASGQEYADWVAHLRDHNIALRQSDHKLCRSLYFSDPFGNQLEITTYDMD